MDTRRNSFVVMGFIIIGSSWIAAPASAEAPAAPSVDTAAQEAAQTAALQKTKRQQDALAQLNGRQWTIELTPMSGERPKRAPTDTLLFSSGKISSERLANEGFEPSNFTLSVGDDNLPVWETMQTKPDGGNAFWRGELHGERMSGILSRHAADGAAQDFSFVGAVAGNVAAAAATATVTSAAQAPEKPAQASSAPSATLTPGSPQPKKKKRGWFGN